MAKPKSPTLGELGDRLFYLYEEKDGLTKQVSALTEQIQAIEGQLLSEMEKVDLDKITCALGSLSRAAELYPSITNWETLLHFADEEGYTSMIQKRVSSTAFKEYFKERGEFPPGTEGTTGWKLNRRKSK